MNTNEIKKALYREKPIARKYSYNLVMEGGVMHYKTILSNGVKVYFKIPVRDAPENLAEEEPAQLLIRWLVTK